MDMTLKQQVCYQQAHRIRIKTNRHSLPEISFRPAPSHFSVVSILGGCIARSQARRSLLAELPGFGI